MNFSEAMVAASSLQPPFLSAKEQDFAFTCLESKLLQGDQPPKRRAVFMSKASVAATTVVRARSSCLSTRPAG